MQHVYKTPLARTFASASSQYLSYAGAVLTGVPITMACWYRRNTTGTNRTLMAIGRDVTANHYFAMDITTTNQLIAAARAGGTVGSSNSSSGAIRDGYWEHCGAIFVATASRFSVVNGAFSTENTASRTPASLDRTTVGAVHSGSPTQYCDGDIVWPAIWNIALAANDMQLLARGAHPLSVHPEAIVAFWEWEGHDASEIGLRGNYTLTNSGSVPVGGPGFLSYPVLPRRRRFNSVAAPAGGNRRRRVIMCGSR